MRIDYTRPWMPEYQRRIIDSSARYTITEATTKAGKTVSHIIFQFEEALKSRAYENHWWVAPTVTQSKIAYHRMKKFISQPQHFDFNETERRIITPNDAIWTCKTAEIPDNLYGEDVYSVVFDEFTRAREESFFALRSTITATGGKMKFIGNVNGIGNWGYKLARKAEAGRKNWEYFKITANDAVHAGILSQEEINDAKDTLPEGIFNELYYGIPFVNSSNKFCFAFDEKKHIGSCSYDPRHPLYLSFDFNKNPICCVVIQCYDPGIGKKKIFVPDVIKLANSDIYRLSAFIRNRYEVAGHKPLYLVCGDASGNAGSAMVKGLTGEEKTNYFTIIKSELEIGQSQMQQLPSNPKLEDNQVLVNALFEHYPLGIDPEYAAALIFDCKFVEMRPDGTIKKADRDDPAQQADALDGFRYYLNRYHRDFIKTKR